MSEVSTQPTRVAPGGETPVQVDARVFWKWVWDSVYPVLGWILVGLGLLAIVLGWWGVSRNAIVAKQLPYLVSGGLVGVALVTLGGRLILVQDLRRDSGRLDRVEQMVNDLHMVLLTRVDPPAQVGGTPRYRPEPAASANGARTRAAQNGSYLVLPGGEWFHREGCPMVDGKDNVSTVRRSTATRRRLSPCPLCEPVETAATSG